MVIIGNDGAWAESSSAAAATGGGAPEGALDAGFLVEYTNGNTMSKSISAKIQDDLYREMEELARRLDWPKNAYINEAIAHFNRHHARRLLAQALRRESQAVGEDSLQVLSDFEALRDDLP